MPDTFLKTALEFAKQWGLFAAFCVFFIWRSDVRETEMRAEMDRDRTFMRDTLVDALEKNTTALTQCTSVLARVGERLAEGHTP